MNLRWVCFHCLDAADIEFKVGEERRYVCSLHLRKVSLLEISEQIAAKRKDHSSSGPSG